LPQISGLTPAAQRKLTEALGDIAADAKKRLASVTLAQLKPINASPGNKTRRTG
jgi:hypothetical protein